jgi:fatty-acyl-CoA synthase
LQAGDKKVSFAELYAWQARVAAYLSDKGVRPGNIVGIVGTNSMEYCVLGHALMRIGAIAFPMNFRLTPTELRESLEDKSASLVFTDSGRRERVREALSATREESKLCLLEDLTALRIGAAVDEIPYETDPDSPIVIISTSGSTARPKGVVYTHRTLLTYACEFVVMEPRCGKGSSILVIPPLSAASGFLVSFQFMSMGARVILETAFDAQRALKTLVEEKVTSMQGVPIFFEQIAAQPGFVQADLSSLYWAQVGGAPVRTSLLQTWLAKGVTLRALFGQTESGGAWAARDQTALSDPDKCGRGGLFTDFAIRDEKGLRSPGQPGEIVIRGPSVTPGYWNNEEATREAIKDGWLHTGDWGVLDESGDLTFIDRIKDIIISGGLNISAAEVERAVAEVPGIIEVAAIAADDERFGETPLVVVYCGDNVVAPKDIIAHCDRRLANFKVPRYVAFEKEPLPRVSTGKISKPVLRQRYKGAAARLPKLR